MPQSSQVTWYNVAEFIKGRQSVQELLMKHPWTQEFLLPIRFGVSYEAPIREFNINPLETITILRRLSNRLYLQEIAMHLCNKSEYTTTFIQICEEIMQYSDKARADATLSSMINSPGLVTAEGSSGTPVAKSTSSGTKLPSIPDKLTTVIQQHRLTYERFYGKSDLHMVKEVVVGVLEGVDRLRDDDIQNEVNLVASEMNNAAEAMDIDRTVSDLDQLYHKGSQPSSQLLVNFAYNIAWFANIATGQDDLGIGISKNVAYYLKLLSETDIARSQQFNPIYAEIQQLRSIIEKQNQIITSLKYRRLLENLPNKDRYNRVLKLTHARQKTGTRYWKAAWEDLVKEETRLMILAKTVPTNQKRPLTGLFEHDFNWWWQNNKAATSVPVSIFKTWPAYARGEALYGELSSNIHQHDTRSGEPYDFKPSNWPRSDRLILSALRPDEAHIIVDSEGIMDVEWDKERKRQGLK